MQPTERRECEALQPDLLNIRVVLITGIAEANNLAGASEKDNSNQKHRNSACKVSFHLTGCRFRQTASLSYCENKIPEAEEQ